MSVSADKKAEKRADKKAKSIFTCVPFMLKYIYQCDKLIIPLKAIAAIIAAVKTYIWAVYLKWIIDFERCFLISVLRDAHYVCCVFGKSLYNRCVYPGARMQDKKSAKQDVYRPRDETGPCKV